MLNILIIEDEPATARLLKSMLMQIEEIEVLDILDSVSSTIEWFRSNTQHLDLVFMDIRLSDGLSLDIFLHVTISVPVIFVTAYEEYTLSAFKTTGIDYILKPFDQNELKRSFEKFKLLYGKEYIPDYDPKPIIEELKKAMQSYKQSFLVNFRNKMIPLSVKNIACITTINEVSFAYSLDGKKYALDNTLEEFTEMLDPKLFFRANRQFLIQKDYVKDLDFYFTGRLIVNLSIPTDDKIIVSKARVSLLKKWMNQ